MKRNFISLAIASAFAAFTLTACGEDTPNNPTPDPFGGVARAKFHNQVFEGTGVVFEIEPQGNLDVIKYAFEIEGKDIFHDKNLNGKKDADEKLDNKFKGILEMPAKNNKGLFVILGDVYILKFLTQNGDEVRTNDKSPICVKSSNFDGARCLTLIHFCWPHASIKELVFNGKKNIKSLEIYSNDFTNNRILEGLDNLEYLDIADNEFSGDIDLRHLKKVDVLDVSHNKEANFIFPEESNATTVNIGNTKTKHFSPKRYPNLHYLFISDWSIDNNIDINEIIKDLPNRTGKEPGTIYLYEEEYSKADKEKLKKLNWERSEE